MKEFAKVDRITHRFGVISDTQERKGEQLKSVLEPLKELEASGLDMDFIVQLGDLAETGEITKFIREAKKLKQRYDEEKIDEKMSAEMINYEKGLNSQEYQEFNQQMKEKGVDQEIVIYALWKAKENGVYDQAISQMEMLIKNVTDELGFLKTEVRHIMGNADRPFPEKFQAVEKFLEQQHIISYNQPTHLDLDKETSIVFWPSMAIDENDEKQVLSMLSRITDFALQMKDKRTILIFAHETPFKGPQKPGVYAERVAQAGLKGSERVPYNQYLPVSKYALELCRRLPAEAKISLACGHMHVPREVIEAGTRYLKFDETGKAKLRLFGLAKKIDQQNYPTIPGKKRTIDLYYLPEGEVGLFEIDEDGDVLYRNLLQEKK